MDLITDSSDPLNVKGFGVFEMAGLTRRKLLTTLGAHIGASTCCGVYIPNALAFEGGVDCLAPTKDFMKLSWFAKPDLSNGTSVKGYKGTLLSVSDDKEFDRALGRIVLEPLAADFGVNPGFGYYDENEYGFSPNALANPNKRVPTTRGTVVLGLQLLRKLLRRERGDYAVVATCAHEFGHVKQFETGLAKSFLQEHGKRKGRMLGELHADFIAGYYLAALFEKSTASRFELQKTLNVIGLRWDEMGSGTPSSPGRHGTSAQRVLAIESGYKYSAETLNANIDQCMARGKTHVERYL